jgi:hypothetical protein
MKRSLNWIAKNQSKAYWLSFALMVCSAIALYLAADVPVLNWVLVAIFALANLLVLMGM